MYQEWKIFILGLPQTAAPQTPGVHETREKQATHITLLGKVKQNYLYQNPLQSFNLPSVGPKQMCTLAHLGCTLKAVTSQL